MRSPVRSGRYSVFDSRSLPKIDRSSRPIAKLEVPGDEVGVQVSQDDVLDAKSSFVGKRQVVADVTLRVDDGGYVRVSSSPMRYDACAKHFR